MTDAIQSFYAPALLKYGFVPQPEDHRFGPNGLCWRQADDPNGWYWIYVQDQLFNIKIHDFSFPADTLLEFRIPKCLSVTWYESISGDELSPYRRVGAGCVKTFLGGEEPYRILIHKNVPIRSIGIEIDPAYYEEQLKKQYPGEYEDPREAFRLVDQTEHFPEMVRLLREVRDYRGEGLAAKLFYEGKAAQATSLVVERSRGLADRPPRRPLPAADLTRLEDVTAYIDDHCAAVLPLERLARIACMGSTKLKSAFRQVHDCTLTEYIQARRMSMAEHLLSDTELTVGQVAQSVGYRNQSRFAELFRRGTGLSPAEFRRAAAN